MRPPRHTRSLLWVVPFLVVGIVSCSKSDTTTAPGAIATVTLNAPDTATSGQSFDVTVDATAVGVNNVHNGLVTVMVPTPLTVQAASPSSGTTASFTSGSATWNLGTLDSNSGIILWHGVTAVRFDRYNVPGVNGTVGDDVLVNTLPD